MKATWLHRIRQPRALLFFAGWGMDEAPFRKLASGQWDVLTFYDYRRVDEVPCLDEISAYPELAVAAWSLGCAAANAVAQRCGWTFSRAVAISGTLIPEDDQAGIPARWLDATTQHLTEGGWDKFVRRMCSDEPSRAAFDAARPGRPLPEAVEELQALRRLSAPAACIFHAAAVSEWDRILLPENQRQCWARYAVPTRRLPAPHYPFHLWASWEEVLACAG